MIPCDLCPVNDFRDCKLRFQYGDTSGFKFSLAPRSSIYVDWFQREDDYFRRRVARKKSLRLRERFLLGGLLQSWHFLYNETPAESSWIWDWYPDGEEWRQAVKDHGQDALSSVLFKRKMKRINHGTNVSQPVDVLQAQGQSMTSDHLNSPVNSSSQKNARATNVVVTKIRNEKTVQRKSSKSMK